MLKRVGLDVHEISLASGSAEVLGYEVFPAKLYRSGTCKRKARIRSVARTISTRRGTGGWAVELVSGNESFLALSISGALSIFDASFKFALASHLVSGEPWSSVRSEQKAFGEIPCLVRGDWSLRWLDVCICTAASEKDFAFAVREGCRELAPASCRVSERTTLKRSCKSIRARSRALRSISPEVGLECSSSDEDEARALKESRADFLQVSLQLLDPSEWTLAAYRAFFRDEGIIILEARSLLYAVRYVESCYPRGRLLILSVNLALVLSLCKGRSNIFTLLAVMRRIFASGFRVGCAFIASLTVIMTWANLFFMFLLNAHHRFHRHGHATKTVNLRLLCTWMLVKLTVHLRTTCPQ